MFFFSLAFLAFVAYLGAFRLATISHGKDKDRAGYLMLALAFTCILCLFAMIVSLN